MLFQLYYKQSADERYHTAVNASVRNILDTARIKVVEEWGGSELAKLSNDPEGAEAAFVVDTTLVKVSAVSECVSEILKRPVEVTEVES